MLSGEIFAERNIPKKKRSGVITQEDAPEALIGDFTEFGTLPREMITRLGLRHVSPGPVVLKEERPAQVDVYRAEVFEDGQWRTVYVCEDDPDKGWHKCEA